PQHVCKSLMTLVCFPPSRVRVARVEPPIAGIDRAAVFLPESSLHIAFWRPARHVEVRLAPEPAEGMCVDFDAHALGDRANGFTWHGLTLTVFDASGRKQAQATVRDVDGVRVLDAGSRTEVAIPVAAATVTLRLLR